MEELSRILLTGNVLAIEKRCLSLIEEQETSLEQIDFKKSELRQLLQVLDTNPSLALSRFVTLFDYPQELKHEPNTPYFGVSDKVAGMSLLQVAVSRQDLNHVQSLLRQNAFLYHRDLNENTVFHYSTTKQILALLLKDANRLGINWQNRFHYTALHLACLRGDLECLKLLLLAGGDINVPFTRKIDINNYQYTNFASYIVAHPKFLIGRNIQFGGTMLHWSKTPTEIHELLQRKCDVNAIDFKMRTALHIMVEKRKFDCIIALLSWGADPNIQDLDGNSAIHLAVLIPQNIHVLHSLIAFGVDLNVLNNQGKSPRHLIAKMNDVEAVYCLHAVGAKRCAAGVEGCNDYCSKYGNSNGEPPIYIEEYRNLDTLVHMLDVAGMQRVTDKHKNGISRNGRLLSLDGGGIRGLLLIQMLLELENMLGKPINRCFDWITGTSTGGILAIGLASGKTAKECLGLYFRFKEQMFSGRRRPYPSKPLEEVLKGILGDDTYLSDIQHPKLIIPCCTADCRPVDLILYRNYESPTELLKLEEPPADTLLWHVARATSAAPTYFRPFNGLIDGGLIANNPTIDALTEIHEYNVALTACQRQEERCPVNIVVSLGTGLAPLKDATTAPEFLPDLFKLVWEANDLLSILVDQATAADGRVVDRARAWCASIGVPYFRFSPYTSEDVRLDEKCDVTLCRTLWETKAYMYANRRKMRELADLLKDN